MARSKTSISVASHVTAYGRLRLYDVLGDPALKEVLYCDTDCVWFAAQPGFRHPLEGSYLGDWEDEAPAGVCYDEFVALAPKLYSVRDSTQPTNPAATKLKCKGFRMSNDAKMAINFNSLKHSLTPDDETGEYPDISVTYNHFRRQKHGGVFVGSLTKSLCYNPTTTKSLSRGMDFYVPYGPHCERPGRRTVKRTQSAPTPLPPLRYTRRRLDRATEEPEETETEMDDSQQEFVMAQAIRLQDLRRAES